MSSAASDESFGQIQIREIFGAAKKSQYFHTVSENAFRQQFHGRHIPHAFTGAVMELLSSVAALKDPAKLMIVFWINAECFPAKSLLIQSFSYQGLQQFPSSDNFILGSSGGIVFSFQWLESTQIVFGDNVEELNNLSKSRGLPDKIQFILSRMDVVIVSKFESIVSHCQFNNSLESASNQMNVLWLFLMNNC